MALNKEQKEKISILVKVGKLSNRAIAKEVGCSESAVRTHIKNNNIEKNAINALVHAEVDTLLMQKEINKKKNALNNAEREAYNNEFIDLRISLNLFNNSTLDNQNAINTIQKQIIDSDITEDDLISLGTISKITETNRKQLFGNTEPLKIDAKPKETKPLTFRRVEKKEDL